MKKILSYIFMYSLFLLYSCNLESNRSYTFEPMVEIGQVWTIADYEDPFFPYIDTITIIDIKKNYALCKHVKGFESSKKLDYIQRYYKCQINKMQ